ncbi:T-complex protein 11-like protein 1 [Amphiprion ocellaris]|uniref:T-complex protein 11-like protein 1 n=1 Tax=Amphiprion ocellaris TaxID=80972 RepID=UPI00241120D9|nr:T-complex protein 11-like protein 1 [Amphiprion ocellaris]
MASIRERAAALQLAEKLRVRPPVPAATITRPSSSSSSSSSSMWNLLISNLRSSVTVKRRRVHLKSHSDCFVGSEAVDVLMDHIGHMKGVQGPDVRRDKVVLVCQCLLNCSVFESVGSKMFGKDKKQDEFQDSKNHLYSSAKNLLQNLILGPKYQIREQNLGPLSKTFPSSPQTVLMDQVRFQEMQQEADQLVLLSSVLLIVYTTAGEAISGLPGLMETLKNTVSVMLADMHSPSFSLQDALATVGEKLCVELSQCLSQHGFSPFSADRSSILKGQISATVQPDNKVRKLMESRVQSYLLASLESSQHQTPPPLPGGLVPVSRELKELAVRFSRLVNFNKLVFSPFYQKILQEILTSGEVPSKET